MFLKVEAANLCPDLLSVPYIPLLEWDVGGWWEGFFDCWLPAPQGRSACVHWHWAQHQPGRFAEARWISPQRTEHGFGLLCGQIKTVAAVQGER